MRVPILIALLAFTQAGRPANVTGTWQWRGPAGWQRLELDLRAEGQKLTGTIRMGPGPEEPVSTDGLWQYFFDPVEFKITNGTIAGNSLSFQQVIQKAAPVATSPATPFGVNRSTTLETRLIYKGVVAGDRIQMSREWIGNDPWTLGNHRVEFELRRIK
jgi:hypothetical protein